MLKNQAYKPLDKIQILHTIDNCKNLKGGRAMEVRSFLAMQDLLDFSPSLFVYLTKKQIKYLQSFSDEELDNYLNMYCIKMFGPFTYRFVVLVVETDNGILRFYTPSQFIRWLKSV